MKRTALLALGCGAALVLWQSLGRPAREVPIALRPPAAPPVRPHEELADFEARSDSATGPATEARTAVPVAPRAMEASPEPRLAASLRGRVVDASTREAIAYATLEVQGEAGSTWRGTAEGDGSFETSTRFASEALFVQLDEGRIRSTAIVPHPGLAGERPDILLRVGPTYRLLVEAPAELDLANLRAEFHGSRNGTQALRLEPETFLRMPWDPALDSSSPPWQLELRSADRRWFGAAEVEQIVGRQLAPVAIRMERRGALAGGLWNAEGDRIEGVALTLETAEGERLALGIHYEEYQVDDLPVGRAMLVASSALYEIERVPVVVPPGPPGTVDVVLHQEKPPGIVSGRVVCAHGGPQLGLTIQLESDSGEERTQVLASDGRFRFESVPAGTGSLLVSPPPDSGLEPADAPFTVPAEDVELELRPTPRRDPGPSRHYVLIARDELTGEPVRPCQVYVNWSKATGHDPPIGTMTMWSVRDEGDLGIHWPGTRFEWRLAAPGYAPEVGDETNFDPSPLLPLAPDTETVLEELCVYLRPGWGTSVLVQDESGEGLAGVPVLLDGEPAGSSGARGLLEVYRRFRPLTLGVGGGWQLASGGMVHPRSGAFGNPFPTLVVTVARR